MATATTDIASSPAPHILVVPCPAQGHMLALLDLTGLLASRGLRLTVVTTPATAPQLAPLRAAHPASIRVLTLPFPSHPALPPGIESAKHLPPALFPSLIVAFSGLRGPLGSWARARSGGPDRVAAVLSDFFCGWTQPLAAELGVPRFAFSPCAAYGTAVIQSLFRRLPARPEEVAENDKESLLVTFPDLPGEPAYPWRQISMLYRSFREGDEVSEGLRSNFLWNLESSGGFVLNTFRRMEERFLAGPLPDLGLRPMRAVGPLAPDAADAQRGGEMAVAAADLRAWLDEAKDDVVYVSFGSMAVLQPAHAAALAVALESTGVAFVWAVAPTTRLPEGFERRVVTGGGKGKVIRGWAPQVAALRHGAVRWFVTHCGWNSVLEATAAGVPMLAWPMTADQFANARLLVEDLHAAVPVTWGGLNLVPEADEVARVLDDAVRGRRWGEVAVRATELAAEAEAAVCEGGDSWMEVEELAGDLRKLGNEPGQQQ